MGNTTKAGKNNHGKFKADGTTHSIPSPLAIAFENLVIGRQLLGEENDFLFGQSLLLDLIEIWNNNIKQLKEEFAASIGSQVLQSIDENPLVHQEDQDHHTEVSQATMDALKDTLDELQTIVIAKTPSALRIFG